MDFGDWRKLLIDTLLADTGLTALLGSVEDSIWLEWPNTKGTYPQIVLKIPAGPNEKGMSTGRFRPSLEFHCLADDQDIAGRIASYLGENYAIPQNQQDPIVGTNWRIDALTFGNVAGIGIIRGTSDGKSVYDVVAYFDALVVNTQ